jgi:hypothetical protein
MRENSSGQHEKNPRPGIPDLASIISKIHRLQ